MKNLVYIITCLFAVSSFTAAQTVPANSNEQKRTISVTGDAQVKVVPNQVLIAMTIETRGQKLLAIKKKNDDAIKMLLSYITNKAKVDKKHIQTDYVSLTPEYEECSYRDRRSGECDPLNVIYYTARKGIQLRLNDLDKYEEIITKALEFGVTSIDNVQFVTTKLRKHRDRARELAAKAAQEKAEAVAGTLGMKVLKPISINLNNTNWYYGGGYLQRGRNTMSQNIVQSASSGSGMSDSQSLALGQINITAQIGAVFEVE